MTDRTVGTSVASRAHLARTCRRVSAVLATVAFGLMTIAALPASAAQVDFCGQLSPSGGQCVGPLSAGYGTAWTYTSNTYRGGGVITTLTAWMAAHLSNGSNQGAGYWFQALNATFVNGCWYNVTNLNTYGIIIQSENSGASHTIYGHNDDSPNHTFCANFFAL